MSQPELEEMLKKIAEAMEEAKGDPIKESVALTALVDPADATACEGCFCYWSRVDWIDWSISVLWN